MSSVMTNGQRPPTNTAINFSWPFPDFKKPQKWWNIRSKYCLFMVGLFGGKFVLSVLNSCKIRNKEILVNAVYNRPAGVPLITVTNHESCIDDPGLIGNFMTFEQLLNQPKMRWSLAAHDICYTRPIYQSFFSHGKCVPVVRGLGVYQKAVDFCIDRLDNYGDWVHIFPEGKVNMERNGLMRLKWGVGRMIADLEKTPIVLPFWHVGMHDVLPNGWPYIPRVRKQVFMNVGEPLQIEPIVRSVEGLSAMQKRKIITDYIQSEMERLRKETLELAKETLLK